MILAGGALAVGIATTGLRGARWGESAWDGRWLAILVTFGLISVALPWAAVSHARRFVVHLEIWPRSNLALVRTAGVFRETIRLVGWNDFRTGQPLAERRPAASHGLSQVRLRSGLILLFDHAAGDAPLGWTALHRFIEKCSLPPPATPARARDAEAATAISAPSVNLLQTERA